MSDLVRNPNCWFSHAQAQYITASDVEFGGGIRRAESCDSVASDSSVLDMQPDMPKIGQLEFALEYDR